MDTVDFHDMQAEVPEVEDVEAAYRDLTARFAGASGMAERLAAVADWNDLRARQQTWSALVNLRFQQNTKDESRKRAREHHDEIEPKLTEFELDWMRALVDSPHRPALEARLGRHVFDLWECAITTYDPSIEAEKIQEAKLAAAYSELLASARLEYMGETLTLSELRKFSEDSRRDVRHGAERVKWAWFAEHGDRLDEIFDQLVKTRTTMAKTLGFQNFVALGYKRMTRIDYDRKDVERYRKQVREHVVPLAGSFRRRQARQLGIDQLRFWDELVFDPRGNPKPQGGHDWQIERAREMFDEMGAGLGEFYRTMVDRHLLDLVSREGKAPGGFCTGFPVYRTPFIYANFNGTRGDVAVFTHEMGHAFQNWCSRDKFPLDLQWPTAESCEIHSMSLEFLTWPFMGKFFGEEEADRLRRIHLADSLLFLPYGVAIDHFQHLVYEQPDATPDERKSMWQEMERLYLPGTSYGDLEYPAAGGRWQGQLHVYRYPFYYIDYTLAQICALQFWVRAERDREEAMQAYVELCRRGGEAPFQQLVKGAGLISPFEDGCLVEAVEQARTFLEV